MRCHKTKKIPWSQKNCIHFIVSYLIASVCVCVYGFVNKIEHSLSKAIGALLFGSSIIHSLFVPVQTLGFIITIRYI